MDPPGIAYSIVYSSGQSEVHCEGFRDIEKNLIVDNNTSFMVASISKLFTGVGILQLYEQNKIDLDKDINEYISVKVNHPSKQPITTRQLLQHKSGLYDSEIGLINWRSKTDSLYPQNLEEHVKERFCRSGSLYNYDEWYKQGLYHYSNAGFTLLGYIIEQVSGKSFIDFMQESLFDPLEFHSASWSVPSHDQIAMPYSSSKQPIGHYCVAEYPACQLRISIDDLSKFLQFFICDGEINGKRLLLSETIQLMCPSTFVDGLAWWGKDAIYGKNYDVWIHGGYMAGVRTQINFYPQYKCGFIILINGESDYTELEAILENKLLIK